MLLVFGDIESDDEVLQSVVTFFGVEVSGEPEGVDEVVADILATDIFGVVIEEIDVEVDVVAENQAVAHPVKEFGEHVGERWRVFLPCRRRFHGFR